MPRIVLRRILIGCVLSLALAGLAVGVLLLQFAPLLSRVVAYKTKQTAALVFITQQSPAAVEAELNEDHALLGWVRITIDPAQQTVAGSLLGNFRHTASYRENLGTVLDSLEFPTTPTPSLPQRHGNSTDQAALPHPDNPERYAPVATAADRFFQEPDRPASVPPEAPWTRRTRAVLIAHQGRIVYERYADGFDSETRFIGWSMTKSVLGLLTLMRVEEGQLTLDAAPDFPLWSQQPNDPRRTIQLQHLMRMTSGLEFSESYAPDDDVIEMLYSQDDMAAYAMNKPLVSPQAVGQHWSYSSGSANLVALALRHSFDGDQVAYLNYPFEKLFHPLRMTSAIFETDGAGTLVGSSSLFATAQDWLKLGQLVVQKGRWGDQALITPDSLSYLFTPASPNRSSEKTPVGMRYGALWWLNQPDPENGTLWMPNVPTDAVVASGHFGQVLVAIPSLDLVVLRLGLAKGGAWSTAPSIESIVEALPRS